MNNLLAAAYKYISNGICVIPTNEQKIPVIPWKIYQDELITNDAAEKAFELPYAYNIGIVTGRSSKNLEVIDIDTKYDITGKLMDAFMADIRDNDPDLFNSLMVIQTRSGGYHLYYRCSYIEGNQKLALRPCNASELADNPADKVRVLIETRGLGGYVVAPPSPGYKMVRGDQIPTITPDQREMLHEFARTYNQIIEEPRREYTTATHSPKEFFTTPWDAYNETGDIIYPLLISHGWQVIKETTLRIQFRRPGKNVGISADYHREKKLFKVFTTSSVFDVGQGYSHYRVFKVLECNNDPSLAARRLIEMGYGRQRVFYGDKIERELYKKRQEGMDETGLINIVVTNHGKSAAEAKEMVDNLTQVWGDQLCTFWEINDKGRPIMDHAKLINFLHTVGGFSVYYYDKNSTVYRIVQCRGGLLQESTAELIKKFVLEYIETLPDTFDCGITSKDIEKLILKGQHSYFCDGLMEFLPRSTYNILQDNPICAYFPFRNGIIRVCGDDVEFINYKDVKLVIWRKQVIDFDIVIDPDADKKIIEYAKFINCIAGDNPIKYQYACTLIGYLLHKYKDPARSFSVILAEENDNDEKGGGTGKGIFLTAITKIINTERLDGKTFKPDKSFAFQRVDLDTRIVAIEDTRKNMDFEAFYSVITEGITVEKKNKDELYIPYKDSPKIVFTTNYSMISPAYHAQRRQKTFDFAGFFGPDKTPDQHFGHRLFDDWDQTEWNLFYNFMFICCSGYLKYGILETGNSEQVRRKNIKLKYGEEFLEWMDDHVKTELNEWHFLGELYDDFMGFSGQDKKFFSLKKFTVGIGHYVTATMNHSDKNVSSENYCVQKRRKTQTGKRTEIAIVKIGHNQTLLDT